MNERLQYPLGAVYCIFREVSSIDRRLLAHARHSPVLQRFSSISYIAVTTCPIINDRGKALLIFPAIEAKVQRSNFHPRDQRSTNLTCWHSGQRAFCFTHWAMQQLWKEWEQSPHTTTHSPEAEGDVEEEPDDGREVKGRFDNAVTFSYKTDNVNSKVYITSIECYTDSTSSI